MDDKVIEEEMEIIKNDPRYKVRQLYDSYVSYLKYEYIKQLSLFGFVVYVSVLVTILIATILIIYALCIMSWTNRFQIIFCVIALYFIASVADMLLK